MEKVVRTRAEVSDGARFIGISFLYLFGALLLTAAVIFGTSLALEALYVSNPEAATPVILGIFIGASILEFITVFVMHLVVLRRNKSILVPYIIYSVLNGLFLGALAIFLKAYGGFENPYYLYAVAFGITAVMFALMGVAGLLMGRRARVIGLIGVCFLIGAFLFGIANWIWFMIFGGLDTMFLIVSAISTIGVLLITVWDVARIKVIADEGQGSNNMALYCSFTLYVDFIYIFMRILAFIIRFSRR